MVATCWLILLRSSAADSCQCRLDQNTIVACKPLMHASAANLWLCLPHQRLVMGCLSLRHCVGAESCQCVLQVTENPNASGSCGCGASFEAKM